MILNKPNYVVFTVNDDSMDDGSVKSLQVGRKILCREIRREFWIKKLHFERWFFVIIDREGLQIVKQITDHDPARGIVKCHSLNPDYEDFELNLEEDVDSLYNIIRTVGMTN